MIASTKYEEIKQQIISSGFTKQIILLNSSAYCKCTLYGKKYLKEHIADYKDTYEILEDDISRSVFINYLKFSISLDGTYLRQIDDMEIRGYFGTELYRNVPNEIIVDAGAFTGDTIDEFLSCQAHQHEHIYAFEPDTGNYASLLSKINCNDRITGFNIGLGEQEGIVYFDSKGIAGSAITEEANGNKITINSLDNTIVEAPVTFIKMDIEGAEAEALRGAVSLINHHHPTLAISAYHKEQDMYELVQLIRKIYPQYRIYYRHTYYYSNNLLQPDLIIYAIDSLREKN